MCLECGCGKPGPTRIDGKPAEEVTSPLVESKAAGQSVGGSAHGHSHPPGHGPDHPHLHDHEADDAHGHAHAHRVVDVHQSILAANDRFAERNRGYFRALGLLVLNVVSSAGSGKTTFIQKTVTTLGARARVGVIVGDLATDNDARRLRATGAPVVQITTGTLCHLDAEMVARAAGSFRLKSLDLLIIENVGNLVCPAAFDLGEDLRVALLSVTEGEDKPLKYPPIFHSAQAIVVNKIDLAAAAEFNREAALANVRRASPHARIFEVSARTGEGIGAWCEYLLRRKSRDAST